MDPVTMVFGLSEAFTGPEILAALTIRADGTQRLVPSIAWPDGQDFPHATLGWLCNRLNRTASGLSIGSLALTRSVKVWVAILLDVVQMPLISPS